VLGGRAVAAGHSPDMEHVPDVAPVAG
jgi:hypothetical protein